MTSPGTHSHRARRALTHLQEVDPALAGLALWCNHRDHAQETVTSGETIYYGPSFEDLSLPEQIGLAGHHILHVALRHSARQAEMASRLGPAFRPRLYNLASDALINEALLTGGHALPRPAVRAQELIALLPGDDTDGANILSDWDTDRLYHALAQPHAGDPSQTSPTVDDYTRKRRFAPDLASEGSFQNDSDIWTNRLEQALEIGRAAGIGIGTTLIHFGDLPVSRVPWEVHLRRLMAKAANDTPLRSYKRPSARWIAREALAQSTRTQPPAFEPGTRRDQRQPRILVSIDTSSSITDAQLDLFASEALGIERRSACDLHLIGFDTQVHVHQRFDHPDVIKRLAFNRGGGTDFAPVFETANRLHPSLLIVLTDLNAPLPTKPRFPVIWTVPARPQTPPKFGRLIVIDR